MSEHPVQWVTAAPLWESFAATPPKMQRPALLTFASDNFMEELAARLGSNSPALTEVIARRQSFRARPTAAPATWEATTEELKLYQPVHGHFNLVAASLVCRQAGLPDRAVQPAQGEKLGFVLRRLIEGQELAWVASPDKGWLPIEAGAVQQLAPGEELHPLFPVNFKQQNQPRRLFVGLIPTASRDSFQAAPQLAAVSPFEPTDRVKGVVKDPRLAEIEQRVLEMLGQLAAQPAAPNQVLQTAQDEQNRQASRFLMLDLAEFLTGNLPAVWGAITDGTPLGRGEDQTLFNTLGQLRVEGGTSPTWRQALKVAHQEWDIIGGEREGQPSLSYDLKKSNLFNGGGLGLANLREQFKAALGPYQPSGQKPGGPPVPKLDARSGVLYLIRCVYQRPQCRPPHPALLSNPTEAFMLAPFFDFDAPARPIRISLPVDTSVAGLRKFNKNVAFLISDQLRQQMSRATDLNKALDGQLASGEEIDLGEICSFSIPIITICALLVLMIFINLLNFVFWWLPFLRFCLPIGLLSKLKGK